jgi:hypothetical protein
VSLPKVTICGWCGRSLGLISDRQLPPGEYAAKISITNEMCDKCKTKFSDEIGKKSDVSHSDATRKYKPEEKKEG